MIKKYKEIRSNLDAEVLSVLASWASKGSKFNCILKDYNNDTSEVIKIKNWNSGILYFEYFHIHDNAPDYIPLHHIIDINIVDDLLVLTILGKI